MSCGLSFSTFLFYCGRGHTPAKEDSVAEISPRDIELNSAVQKKVFSERGSVSANQSKLGSVTAYKNIQLINSSAISLRSIQGDVTVTNENQMEISKIFAHKDVSLKRAVVTDRIRSDWGNVSANQSKLDSVTANNDIELMNSSARDLHSRWGNVIVTNENQMEISKIFANKDISLEKAVVTSRIRSDWGNVSANHSKLENVTANNDIELMNSSARDLNSYWGNVSANHSKLENVTANNDIELINSSARDLNSRWGNVAVGSESQTEISSISANKNVHVERTSVVGRVHSEWGKVSANHSKLGIVTAYNNIELINSSATDLTSEWGSVGIKQTDGTQRAVSHITARHVVIAENSIVDRITLYVDQNKQALLDLTNSKVSEKIVVKMSESPWEDVNISCMFPSKSFFRLFGLFGLFGFGGDSDNESKHFSILVKGDVPSESISFEGFDADEITSQTTDDGILVTGKKK